MHSDATLRVQQQTLPSRRPRRCRPSPTGNRPPPSPPSPPPRQGKFAYLVFAGIKLCVFAPTSFHHFCYRLVTVVVEGCILGVAATRK